MRPYLLLAVIGMAGCLAWQSVVIHNLHAEIKLRDAAAKELFELGWTCTTERFNERVEMLRRKP